MESRVKVIHQELIVMSECQYMKKQYLTIPKLYWQILIISIISIIVEYVIKNYMNIKKQWKILLNKLDFQIAQLHILFVDIVMIRWESLSLQLKIILLLYKNEKINVLIISYILINNTIIYLIQLILLIWSSIFRMNKKKIIF